MNISMVKVGSSIADYFLNLPAEIYSSIFVVIGLSIFAIVIGSKVKKADPLAEPTTTTFIGETIVGGIEKFTINTMGPRFKPYAPYFGFLAMYIPVSFIVGIIGLSSPIAYYGVPLILALTTFIFVHMTAIKYQKWGYFKRFVEPFAVFLPINILTFPVILISLSFRIFGNALAGTIIMAMIYWATGNAAGALLGIFNLPAFNFIGPFVAPVFHAYFDFFGAFIQTLVFISLSCLFVAAEAPNEA